MPRPGLFGGVAPTPEAAETEGRGPMGATEPGGGLLPGPDWWGGEPPPGEEALVRVDCWAAGDS